MKNFIPENYPDFNKYGAPPCSESFPDGFFAEERSEYTYIKDGIEYTRIVSQYAHEKEVKAICSSCPYKVECAEYAINDPSLLGIWGGLTEKNRKEIRTRRKLRSKK